jgi:AmiR/NasT family two-component response regulator
MEQILVLNEVSNKKILYGSMGDSLEYITTFKDILKRDFGIALIYKKEFQEEELKNILSKEWEMKGIILIVPKSLYINIFNMVYEKGIFVVQDDIDSLNFEELVKLMVRSNIKKNKYKDLKKLEEQKIIDVAKGILISSYQKSEDEAHKYIERYSMNYRLPILKASKQIIEMHLKRSQGL